MPLQRQLQLVRLQTHCHHHPQKHHHRRRRSSVQTFLAHHPRSSVQPFLAHHPRSSVHPFLALHPRSRLPQSPNQQQALRSPPPPRLLLLHQPINPQAPLLSDLHSCRHRNHPQHLPILLRQHLPISPRNRPHSHRARAQHPPTTLPNHPPSHPRNRRARGQVPSLPRLLPRLASVISSNSSLSHSHIS